MIPYGRQSLSEEDIAAVEAVLRSDFLTTGPAIEAFEQAVCAATDAPFGVAANSATSSLHLACLALDLQPEDRVWTSPNSFVASANCALYCGAQVDFVDIEPGSWNMDAAALEAKLQQAAAQGALPKIVIPVHFGGQSCDMPRIHALCSAYGVKIIEDASHAIGASYTDDVGQSHNVGACIHSDICVFSFHPVKIVTSGEGGLATTRDAALAQTMLELRSHGITRDPARMQGESHGSWYYQQLALGWNYRMTDIQAALGASQMTRLQDFITTRTALVQRYQSAFQDWPVHRPHLHQENRSAWHLYVLCLESRFDRRAVFDSMRAAGIGVNVHYIPIHLQPYYRRMGFSEGDFPQAERYYNGALTLPLYPDLTHEQQDRVITCLWEALG